MIRGGRPASRTRQPADRNPASKPGRSDASVLPKKSPILNHADMCVSLVWTTSQLAWIIAAVAATDTRIVVRSAGRMGVLATIQTNQESRRKTERQAKQNVGPGQCRAHWSQPQKRD